MKLCFLNFTNKFGDSPATETMMSNYEFRELVLGFLRIVIKNGNGCKVHAAAYSGQVELFQNTSSQKKFKEDCPLFDLVRQEHVTLYNVQISQLYDRIRNI